MNALTWKKSFYAVFFAELLAVMGFGTSVPILPFFLQDLGVGDPAGVSFWVGFINSAGAVALAVMAPIWGKIADSYGRRPMLLRAMFGGAFVIVLIGFATSASQVLFLRIIQGAVTGTVTAATVLVAGIVPEEEVGFRMGLLQTAIFIGNSLGPLFGGVVADLFGVRVTFFMTSLLLFAAGLIVKYGVVETFLPLRPDRFRWKNIVPDFSPLFTSRPILVLLILAGLIQVANSAVIPILPLHVQAISHDAARIGTITGTIIGVSALASALSAALMGRLSGRFGYGKALFAGLAVTAVLHIPQAFAGTPVLLLVFRTIGSFTLGLTLPVINALIAARANKSSQGSVYGLSSSVVAIGSGIGPMAGAFAAVATGFSSVFFLAAIVLAGAAYMTKKTFLSGGKNPEQGLIVTESAGKS